MIRLIASDVDGTLIKDSTPDLYPEMVRAIRELKKRGILFCAASGRQYESLRNVFREVADDIAYIAENGALICYRNEIISVTPMKREHITGIMKMLRPYYGRCEAVVWGRPGEVLWKAKIRSSSTFLLMATTTHSEKWRMCLRKKMKS